MLTLSQALENSCNPYMINITIKLGNVRFAQYEKMFGFGAKTGVDLLVKLQVLCMMRIR